MFPGQNIPEFETGVADHRAEKYFNLSKGTKGYHSSKRSLGDKLKTFHFCFVSGKEKRRTLRLFAVR